MIQINIPQGEFEMIDLFIRPCSHYIYEKNRFSFKKTKLLITTNALGSIGLTSNLKCSFVLIGS